MTSHGSSSVISDAIHVDASNTMLIPENNNNDYDNTQPIYFFDAEEQQADDDMSSLDAAATLSFVSAAPLAANDDDDDDQHDNDASGEEAAAEVTPPSSISLLPDNDDDDDEDEESYVQVDEGELEQVLSPSDTTSSLYMAVLYDMWSSVAATRPVTKREQGALQQQKETLQQQQQQKQKPQKQIPVIGSSARPTCAPRAASPVSAETEKKSHNVNTPLSYRVASDHDDCDDNDDVNDYAPGQRLDIIGGVYKGKRGTFVYSTDHRVAVHVDGYPTCNGKPKSLSKSSVRAAAAAVSHHHDNDSSSDHATTSTRNQDQDNDSVTMTPNLSHRGDHPPELLLYPSPSPVTAMPNSTMAVPVEIQNEEEALLLPDMILSSASVAVQTVDSLPDVVASSLTPHPQAPTQRQEHSQQTVPNVCAVLVQPAPEEARSSTSVPVAVLSDSVASSSTPHPQAPRQEHGQQTVVQPSPEEARSSSHSPPVLGSVALVGGNDDGENSETSRGDDEDDIRQPTLVSNIVTPSPHPSRAPAAAAATRRTTTRAPPSVVHASSIRDATGSSSNRSTRTPATNRENAREYAVDERLYIIGGKYKGGMCTYVRSTKCKAFVNVDGYSDGPKPLDKASVSRSPPPTDNVYGYAVHERLYIIGGTYKGKMGTFVKSTPCKTFVNVDGYTDGPKALNKSSVSRHCNGSNSSSFPVSYNRRRSSPPPRAATSLATQQEPLPDYIPSLRTPPRTVSFSSTYPRGEEQQQQMMMMTPATATTLNETRSSISSGSPRTAGDENDSVQPATHLPSHGRENQTDDAAVFIIPSIVTPPPAPTHALAMSNATVARGGRNDDEYLFLDDPMEVVEYDDESSFVEVVGNSIMFPHDATPVTTATLLRTHLPTTSSNTTTPQQLLYQGRNNSSRSPIFSRAARAAVGAPVSALPASPRINRRLVSGDPIVIISGVHKGKRGTFIRETAARICAQIDGLDTERFLAPKNIQRADATRAM